MWQRYTIPAGTTVINWIIDYTERVKQLQVISQASQHGGAAALKVLSRLSLSDCLRLKHTHTHTFNGPFSGTTQVSQYQKGKTNLDSTEARFSEWQWHQLGHMQICTSLQTDNHASNPPGLTFDSFRQSLKTHLFGDRSA